MSESDLIRLRHMLDAAEEALGFAVGLAVEDLQRDRKLFHSVVRDLTIIGEAASKISREFKAQECTIPWGEMIAMRNRLIHAYFDVEMEIVWKTLERDLPDLIGHLRRLLGDQ